MRVVHRYNRKVKVMTLQDLKIKLSVLKGSPTPKEAYNEAERLLLEYINNSEICGLFTDIKERLN